MDSAIIRKSSNDNYDAINGVLAARPLEHFSAKLRYSYVDKSGGSFQYLTAPDSWRGSSGKVSAAYQ